MAKKLVPPDGGWGWFIMFAYALNHLIIVPIMQSFGLVFKDTFVLLGFSATDGSIIINTNAAVSMFTGIINGPLLKYYGCRKVAYASAFFTTVGVVLTAFADSFTYFLITYGLIASIGMGMSMSAYPLALNSYFLKNRSKATGITMTVTGLGPVLMPQLISLLLYLFNVQGAVIIIGGVAAHTFIAATLLQPAEWHMKEEEIDEESGGNEKIDETKENLIKSDRNENEKLYDKRNSLMQSVLSIDHDLEIQAIYGFDTPLGGSVLSLNQGGRNRLQSISSYRSAFDGSGWRSAQSVNKIDANSNRRRISEIIEEKPAPIVKEEEKPQPDSLCKRIMKSIVNIFDLGLLKDPIYVNIMLGMSIAIFAELNFSLLTPFILADFNLSTVQIASFLSLLSIVDILFRFLSPYIGDFLNKPARIMYMFSLFLLIITRSSLLIFTTYNQLLGVAVALGFAKGIRTVYWNLVLPNYVPIEKLANASGLQMVINGFFILLGGPLLGLIRDVTGSYRKCLYVINFVTFVTILMWTVEILYIKYKTSKKKQISQVS